MTLPSSDDFTRNPSRGEILRRYDILDTPPEQSFDDIVLLATQLCGTPIGVVTLIDDERQWFKSCVGLGPARETGLSESICVHAIEKPDDLLVIEDALLNPAFARHPVVIHEPFLRFYAGAPLVTSRGDVLGTLCVADRKPGQLSPAQRQALQALARQVVSLIESRNSIQLLKQEIAERRQAEEKLTRQNVFTEALLESLHDGIVACDNQGLLTVFNRATREFHGLPALPLPPAAWSRAYDLYRSDGCTPLERDEIPLHKALRGEVVKADEFTIAPKGGSVRHIVASGQPIKDKTGAQVGAVVAMRDVTEQKRIEAELISARHRAEQATRAKGEFLANMSHEIRTPMNGVMGFTQLLLRTELSPTQRQYVETVNRSCASLLKILNDILDIAKVDAGKLELERIGFDPVDAAHDATNILAGYAEQKGVDLRMEVQPGLRRTLLGDPNRLQQVLINLIGNALKFTSVGNVTVTLKRLDNRPEKSRIRFEVRDTGPGISREKIGQLFQPFAQADSSVSRTFGGTGLGLTISQRLVELMGGSISVESEPGVGSTFSFELEFDHASPQSAPTRKPFMSEAAQRPLAILVVDDDVTNRMLATTILKLRGHSVSEAPDGKKALVQLTREKIDVIITDMQMPDLDGPTLTRMVRTGAVHADRQVPIIGMTASAFAEDRQKCADAGMDAYLPKPYNPQELVQRVEELANARA